jgi:carboxymethylenebutenolidase
MNGERMLNCFLFFEGRFMKYIIQFFITLIAIPSFAQHSCCTIDANTKFISMAATTNFIRSHDAPLPYKGPALGGTMINFPVSGGANGSAYLIKSAKHPNKVILMFHEWWGLNDYIKSTADSLSKELEVTVCALDLYDGKVATTSEDASKYSQGAKPDRVNAIIDGAIANFGKATHFGTIGWCWGGTWSMQTALRAGEHCDACVIYYGMPELNEDRLKDLHAPVLGIFGTKDKWITPKVVSEFQEAMKKAGKRLSVNSYDADHGFANPSNPHHDQALAEEAHRHAAFFLKRKMQLY